MHPTPIAAAVLAAFVLMAPAAQASDPGPLLTPEAFESYATGHTLTFQLGGAPYGMEQYLPGRRVIWAFIGEPCREGRWFPVQERICFEYDDEPGRLHCWQFFDSPDGLVARSSGMGPNDLVAIDRSTQPMDCPGPEVGV